MSLNIDLSWPLGTSRGRAAFEMGKGITALIGKSGAGKTSLARAICGLEDADGTIELDGRNISGMSPQKRSIGLVMQKPALFPTMSVEQNISLSAKLPAGRIHNLIELADIRHLLTRPPQNLSGGEAKRVALVRAIAAAPELLILDEPLTGLDNTRRTAMLDLIKKVNRTENVPILFITHQLDEIIAVADQAILIDAGTVLKSGSLTDILSTTETYETLGLKSNLSIVDATVEGRETGLLKASVGTQTIWVQDEGEKDGSALTLRILASDVALATSAIDQTSIQNILEAEIAEISTATQSVTVKCKIAGGDQYISSQITKRAADTLAITAGQKVYLLIKAVAIKDLRNH